jgi:hypothetical protein
MFYPDNKFPDYGLSSVSNISRLTIQITIFQNILQLYGYQRKVTKELFNKVDIWSDPTFARQHEYTYEN